MTTTLCLVTDRRRLCAELRQPPSAAEDLLLEQIEGAVRGGVDLVQIREFDLDSGPLSHLVKTAMRIASNSHTRVIVNDRVDIAIAAAASGVHLREVSIPLTAVRRLLPAPALVGQSVHAPATIRRSPAADYFIAGTVFPTSSKHEPRTLLGPAGLAELIRMAAGTPVLAIGGITQATIPEVAKQGAAGIAGIGAFIPSPDGAPLAMAVEKLARELRFAFDSNTELP